MTYLMIPPAYPILLPLRGTALLTSNEARTDAAATNKVSSASILPGHTLEWDISIQLRLSHQLNEYQRTYRLP